MGFSGIDLPNVEAGFILEREVVAIAGDGGGATLAELLLRGVRLGLVLGVLY